MTTFILNQLSNFRVLESNHEAKPQVKTQMDHPSWSPDSILCDNRLKSGFIYFVEEAALYLCIDVILTKLCPNLRQRVSRTRELSAFYGTRQKKELFSNVIC